MDSSLSDSIRKRISDPSLSSLSLRRLLSRLSPGARNIIALLESGVSAQDIVDGLAWKYHEGPGRAPSSEERRAGIIEFLCLLKEIQRVFEEEGSSPLTPSTATSSARLARLEEDGEASSPLILLIDPGDATPEELGELLAELSALYRMFGGSGIDFRMTDVRESALEPVR